MPEHVELVDVEAAIAELCRHDGVMAALGIADYVSDQAQARRRPGQRGEPGAP